MKDDIPKLLLSMVVSQVGQRIEGGAMLGLDMPDIDRYHADKVFGGEGTFGPEDEAVVSSAMKAMAEDVSLEILRRGISGVNKEKKPLDKRGLEYALEEYGYRPLLEKYVPELLQA